MPEKQHAEIAGSDRPEDRRIPRGRDFLSRDELAQITPGELVSRMTAIGELASTHAALAEQLRRPVQAVWSAIRASGFFYQFVPRTFGGLGGDLGGFIDSVLPLARACPSTAWSACFCAGHNHTLAHFPRDTQTEVWSLSPYVIAPMLGAPPGKAEPVDGGYRVTGTWSWASGIMDADWVFGMTMVASESEPARLMMTLFPAEEAEVIDTWQVDGLEGSGSNDVRVVDLFVPARRTVADPNMFTGQTVEGRKQAEAIFRAPPIAFAAFRACVPILGAAQGALACFRARLMTRIEKGTQAKAVENPIKLARMAEAQVMILTAETLIRAVAIKVLEASELNGAQQVKLRIEIRAQIAYAVGLCRDAVLRLAGSAGSTMHRREQPFQRFVRDINVMASHVGFEVDGALELYGRALAGLEPNTPMF